MSRIILPKFESQIFTQFFKYVHQQSGQKGRLNLQSNKQYVEILSERSSKLYNPVTKTSIMLIGSNHWVKESEQEIKQAIINFKPQVVMVELDGDILKQVYQKFAKGESVSLKIGDGGPERSKEFWELMGLNPPGYDMLCAVSTARLAGANVIPGEFNTRQLSKLQTKTWMQTLKVQWHLATRRDIPNSVRREFSILKSITPWRMRDAMLSNFTREAQRKVTSFLQQVLPEVWKSLIDDRDKHMVNVLKTIKSSKAVAVVGLAHVDGIESKWYDEMNQIKKQSQR